MSELITEFLKNVLFRKGASMNDFFESNQIYHLIYQVYIVLEFKKLMIFTNWNQNLTKLNKLKIQKT